MGYRQIWHIEDEPEAIRDTVYKAIDMAADIGIQLNHLDFCELDGQPTIDGMDAFEWLEAMNS